MHLTEKKDRMQFLFSALGLIVLYGIIWLIRSVILRGSNAIGDRVSGNSPDRSIAAVTTRLSLKAPISAELLADRIQSTLEATHEKLQFRRESDQDGLALMIEKPGVGAPSLEYLITLVNEKGGCKGFSLVKGWRENEGGRVSAVATIELIHHHVRQAVQELLGTVNDF
jgi:hypothetical protein